MDVTPLIKKDAQVIQSYAGGSFRVSGQSYTTPIIVTAMSTTEWNYSGGVQGLNLEAFEDLIAQSDEIDVVLLGTGAKMEFMDPKLKAALRDKGLSVDVMDTGAACRTYNVLMAEGRRVVAALLLA